MIINKYYDEIAKHAQEDQEKEVCGFVVLSNDLIPSIYRTKNVSSDPVNFFSISPAEFLNKKIKNKIIAIYHSHIDSGPEPSEQDIITSEEIGLPYLIYSLKNKDFFLYYPESFDAQQIYGRPYIKGLYECTCILKDFYKKELNINIAKWNKNYWLPEEDKKANNLLIDILNKQTIKVNNSEIQQNDIIVFELKKNKRFHVGIYLGNDFFVHQPIQGLSNKQILDERWQSKIKHVYRHESFV